MVSIFDAGEKTRSGPWDRILSRFDYLNHSNRREAALVRSFLDKMYSRYPDTGRTNLRGRLRSRDDVAHLGAFFELTMHELLVASGCEIIAIEPPIAGTRKAPDFLARAPNGSQFYVEATLTTGRSNADAAAEKRLEQAIARIYRVLSTDFFLDLKVDGMPAAMVTGKKLQRELQNWVNSLSYEGVTAALQADESAQVDFIYEEHGCRISITPIPRRRTAEPVQRPVGVRMIGGGWIQPEVPIRAAVKGKATRYGNLEAPYLIAVNTMDDFAGEEDSVDAMTFEAFGLHPYSLPSANASRSTFSTRAL